MDVMQAIEERFSVRSFTTEKVKRSDLDTLLNCARISPSGSNKQCWVFIAVDDPEIVRKIKLFSPGMGGYPPAVIALVRDLSSYESIDKAPDGTLIDLAIASENIMLAAIDLGLGTCAVRSYNEAAVSKILGIEFPFKLDLLVTVGYPNEERRKKVRKDFDVVCKYNHM